MHPAARANFKNRAVALKSLISAMPDSFLPKPERDDPNIPIVATLNEEDIVGEFEPSWTDAEGIISARTFKMEDHVVGLHGADHDELRRLAEDFQKALRPEDVVGTAFLEGAIFEWLKRSTRSESIAGFADFVIGKVESSVIEGEIWLPISFLRIQSPFSVGRVEFRLITKGFMDDYEANLNRACPAMLM